MTDPVLLDLVAVGDLANRVRTVAANITGVRLAAPTLAGSAVAGIEAPRLAMAEAGRLGSAVASWAQIVQRCADDLNSTELLSADRLRAR